MTNILLYLPSIMIILAFLSYILLILIKRNDKIDDADGFNVTKDILELYNQINIVENSGYLTYYNMKRKVIKIASKCYYGNGVSDLAIPLMEAGISAIDNKKNKCINVLKIVVSNLKILYIFPLIAIAINHVTYNVNDAKASIIFFVLFSIISYILIMLKSESFNWNFDELKKIKVIKNKDYEKIIKFLNLIISIDKLIFIAELIMIVRCVMIIVGVR